MFRFSKTTLHARLVATMVFGIGGAVYSNFGHGETGDAEYCGNCHAEIVEKWNTSDHAHANRAVSATLDAKAFTPDRSVRSGDHTSMLSMQGDTPLIKTTGSDGSQQEFKPGMVLAYEPLRQYLVEFPGGRWQATELAYDPAHDQWFNVNGEENRHHDEWGFWTNRGMNWNSNCAGCHMTDYRKNYDIDSDSYQSTWQEMGITCNQCHTADTGHGKGDSDVANADVERMSVAANMDNCASCHSRREELTGEFSVGDDYNDHFRLSLPSDPALYYPDGQIDAEVFVQGSFQLSKMGGKAGVTCLNCHDPHSGQLKLPVEDNTLCLSCHTAPGQMNAPAIEPAAHSHHAEGTSGNQCVSCHMASTTYMQRDPRRDHGFVIPDPLLSKELGVPNACTQCHADRDTDWAIETTQQWYGDDMNQTGRARARVIARARAGDVSVVPNLIVAAEQSETPAWTATLVELATSFRGDPRVTELATRHLDHDNALVRSAAVKLLGEIPAEGRRLLPLLEDDSRLVRLDAAWALRGSISYDEPPYEELLAYLQNQADQPVGASKIGQLRFEEGNLIEAEEWFNKAIEWDPYSGALYRALAVLHSNRGRPAETRKILDQGVANLPDDATLRYSLSLLDAETGNLTAAEQGLQKTVALDPGFYRAWYNLGLLYAQQSKLQPALQSLHRAAQVNPQSPLAPYAQATILLRMGQIDLARQAAAEALRRDPGYQPAISLMRQYGQ